MDSRRSLGRSQPAVIMATVWLGLGLAVATAQASEMMSTICNNEVVSVGDRKGEVLAKCGPPLSKAQETVSRKESQTTVKSKAGKKKSGEKTVAVRQKTVKEREESWTYKIEGSYRTFVFKEGRLDRIESGRLAD